MKKNLDSKTLYYKCNYSFTINTDSEGFRIGRRVKGKSNILVLGDSLIFGFVDDNATYPGYLQNILAEKANIYNTGVPGWGFAEYYLLYKHYVKKLDPKIVIVGIFTDNDFDDLNDSAWEGKDKGSMPVTPLSRLSCDIDENGRLVSKGSYYKIPLIRESAVFDFIRFAFWYKNYRRINELFTKINRKPISEELSLKILADMAKNNKTKFIFLILPSKAQFRFNNSPMAKYIEDLKTINNIEVLDLFPILKKKTENLYIDGIHFNSAGNRYIAYELNKIITDKSLLMD
ncbi:MAG TPA: SGNH/GDSL hydrolase family protein [Syntrophorhabdaceae bacterium]|nr:SGNH/GDSL hydrolase family protein [Syntrophorhabdaceae bacterium]